MMKVGEIMIFQLIMNCNNRIIPQTNIFEYFLGPCHDEHYFDNHITNKAMEFLFPICFF